MFVRRLGVVAQLALAVSAVLLPPTVSDFGDDNALETLAVNPHKRTVVLECPGCAVALQDGDSLSWTADTGNAFLLDFEIGAHEDTLTIDGFQLYPPSYLPPTKPISVAQVDPHSEDSPRLRVTGFSSGFNDADTVTEAGTELLPMIFRILSIENRPVNPPALTVNILKDVNGRLMIASIQAAKAVDTSPIEQDKECKQWPLLCKWRSILSDKIDGLKKTMSKACHKHKQNLGNAMLHEGTDGKPPHRSRPGRPHPPHDHHHRPHHHGHHRHGHHGNGHHGHHRVHMFMRRAIFTVLIPIFVGIFAGTLTYLIGMALGCLVAMVVAKVRGRSLYESVAQGEDVADVEGAEVHSEKEVYVQIPDYDEPPVYEEAVEKEVRDESH